MGAAVTGNRRLEEFEFAPLLTFGVLLIGIATLTIWRPAVIAWPIALFAGWTGISFVIESALLWRRRDK